MKIALYFLHTWMHDLSSKSSCILSHCRKERKERIWLSSVILGSGPKTQLSTILHTWILSRNSTVRVKIILAQYHQPCTAVLFGWGAASVSKTSAQPRWGYLTGGPRAEGKREWWIKREMEGLDRRDGTDAFIAPVLSVIRQVQFTFKKEQLLLRLLYVALFYPLVINVVTSSHGSHL